MLCVVIGSWGWWCSIGIVKYGIFEDGFGVVVVVVGVVVVVVEVVMVGVGILVGFLCGVERLFWVLVVVGYWCGLGCGLCVDFEICYICG